MIEQDDTTKIGVVDALTDEEGRRIASYMTQKRLEQPPAFLLAQKVCI